MGSNRGENSQNGLHRQSKVVISRTSSRFHIANPTAALADFTMISGFDVDITSAIPNGATVEIDPGAEPPFIRVLGPERA